MASFGWPAYAIGGIAGGAFRSQWVLGASPSPLGVRRTGETVGSPQSSAEHSEAMRGSITSRQLRTPHPALRATFSPGGEGATPSAPTLGHSTDATHTLRHAGLGYRHPAAPCPRRARLCLEECLDKR
jgi:hypothetical protein